MVIEGKSDREIGEALGFDPGSIWQHCKEHSLRHLARKKKPVELPQWRESTFIPLPTKARLMAGK